jgi:hypothetical protein
MSRTATSPQEETECIGVKRKNGRIQFCENSKLALFQLFDRMAWLAEIRSNKLDRH